MSQNDWKSFSELRPVQQDISSLGYKKEYIEKHRLNETKRIHWCNMDTGIMDFFEPLEVKMKESNVFWRYNENHVHMDIPKVFETQFGTFQNHNNGEFVSWLEKDDYKCFSEKKKEFNSPFGCGGFFVEGNYTDMFDCGEYVYAVSNLMHMGLGAFKIIRIDKNFDVVNIYENYRNIVCARLEYVGRFKNSEGYVVIASGFRELRRKGGKRMFKDLTILFQIDKNGNCVKSKEWEISISFVNSMVVVGDYAYFGQNKMVTRLNVLTGEIAFFTNKTDEELDALVEK